MPERNIVLHPRLWYSREDMAAIRRGFYPTVMGQKWFLIFTGDRLRMHRSWTGNLIFDVGFTFDPQGGAYVSDVIVNRDPEQYQETDNDEDLSLMKNVIQGHLLEPLDAPVSPSHGWHRIGHWTNGRSPSFARHASRLIRERHLAWKRSKRMTCPAAYEMARQL